MTTKEKEKTDVSKELRDQKSLKEVKVPASKIVNVRKRKPLL